MADSEFEQLVYLPPTTLFPKTSIDPYTLVHDLDESSSPSPEENVAKITHNPSCHSSPARKPPPAPSSLEITCVKSPLAEDEIKNRETVWAGPTTDKREPESATETCRRRRRLPEIPKIVKAVRQLSLADELVGMTRLSAGMGTPEFMIGGVTRPLPSVHALRCADSSPDADSGNSTAHSPDLLKSGSPLPYPGSFTPISASSSTERLAQLELIDPTHRGLHRFVPRHRDEVEIDIGDPIYVQKEAEDLWCEGINLRTGLQGIFPSAHIIDMDYSDFDPEQQKVRRERYILGYLGSVETLAHKGNSVVCQAVQKIRQKGYIPHSCIVEVSDTGIRMVDRKKPVRKEVPSHDYFYSLKNVSFCAFHPRDQRYLGFITKHPNCNRFACHVFVGCESTRPVAEAVGRAFQRFYQKYVETAFPVEDIYIE